MNGCDLMDPRFTSCMSTNRNLSCRVINVIGRWLKLTQCDISVDLPVGSRCGHKAKSHSQPMLQFQIVIVSARKCYVICILPRLVAIKKLIQQHWSRRKVWIKSTLCTVSTDTRIPIFILNVGHCNKHELK